MSEEFMLPVDSEIPEWPTVSVVIVTKGNHEEAECAVKTVLATDFPAAKREIVVLEETDSPQPIEGQGVKYLTIPVRNRGVGFARNYVLPHCSGRMIAFTDDDCLVETSWLKELVRPLLLPQVRGSCGRVTVPPSSGPVGKCENILGFPGGGARYFHASNGKPYNMATFSTCNAAVDKEAVGDLLRFEEGFTYAGEDELLSRTISRETPIVYNPLASVAHKPRDNAWQVYRWFTRRGLAAVEILRFMDKPGKRIFSMIHTSLLLRLIVILALLWAAPIPFLPSLSALFLLYCLAILVRYRWAWRYFPSLRVFLILPVIKMTMDMGMSLGILKTLLFGKRKH